MEVNKNKNKNLETVSYTSKYLKETNGARKHSKWSEVQLKQGFQKQRWKEQEEKQTDRRNHCMRKWRAYKDFAFQLLISPTR